MQLFDPPDAKHFCSSVHPVKPGMTQSLGHFHRSLKRTRRLQEGTPHFDIHRVNLLHSTERWLALSVAHYRRAIEMLVPISAPWAQVTLYYASFFGANALLGMFGGWVGSSYGRTDLVDVAIGNAGAQILRITRNAKSPNQAGGSHRAFWDFFYAGGARLVAWTPTELVPALHPVNGDYAWQINERNNVNYDMFEAWSAVSLLHTSFTPARFDSLSGHLALQLEATEGIVLLAQYFADELGLSGAALHGCGAAGNTRRQLQRSLVNRGTPNIVKQTALQTLLS